jgi:hypothetical protein
MDLEVLLDDQLAQEAALEQDLAGGGFRVEEKSTFLHHDAALCPEILRDSAGDLVVLQINVRAATLAHR